MPIACDSGTGLAPRTPRPMSAPAERSRLSGLRQLQIGGLLFLAIVIVATVGYELAGWDVWDAIYMVIITIFGVGYGEVRPVDTVELRIFTSGLIIAGYVAAIYIFGGMVRLITEGEVKSMLNELKRGRSLDGLQDHTIICGYGRIGQILAQDLERRKQSFVILDRDDDRVDQALAAGYLALQGDATEEETLQQAGVGRAQNLATVLPQDALNVFITLTARNLNTDIRIIARGEQPNTEQKLRQAGANEVIMPALIGGHRIAHALASTDLSALFADMHDSGAVADLHRMGLDMIVLGVDTYPQFKGKSLREICAAAGGMLVIGLRRKDGNTVQSPDPATTCAPGDRIIAMVQPELLPADFLVPAETPRRVYRGSEVS